MRKQYYQNDFRSLEGCVSGGCLYISLLDVVAEEFDHKYSRHEIKSIYNLCNERGLLGTDEDKNEYGAFVWDHTGVLNMASLVIGHKEAVWQYSARIYTELEEARGYTSFVNDDNYGSEDAYLIFQVVTTDVPGHFKRFRLDPWKPGTKEIRLKSTRYYKRIQ